MRLEPLAVSFIMTFLAEFGDKTQLSIIALCLRGKVLPTFLGAILAFAAVNGPSVLAGKALAEHLPIFWVRVAAGLVFLVLGLFTLASKGAEMVKVGESKVSVLSSFVVVSLMELGDKTQLSAVTLAAEYGLPIPVFLGVMLALTAVTGIGVTLGASVFRLLPPSYVRVGAALLFILYGVVSLLSAFGLSIHG